MLVQYFFYADNISSSVNKHIALSKLMQKYVSGSISEGSSLNLGSAFFCFYSFSPVESREYTLK
jgi:hypothetical protein